MGNHSVCCLHRDTPTPTPVPLSFLSVSNPIYIEYKAYSTRTKATYFYGIEPYSILVSKGRSYPGISEYIASFAFAKGAKLTETKQERSYFPEYV